MTSEGTDCYRQVVDRAFQHYQDYTPKQSAVIPMLQEVQSEIGYLPEAALRRASELLQLPPSHIYGVVTFYHQFRIRPKGKHMITICRGTACHVGGSLDMYNFLTRQLMITPPEDTSKDGLFTIQQVRCIGACSLAPIMKIDDDVYGKLNPTRIRQIISKYRE